MILIDTSPRFFAFEPSSPMVGEKVTLLITLFTAERENRNSLVKAMFSGARLHVSNCQRNSLSALQKQNPRSAR
jgi:hypothetical protein